MYGFVPNRFVKLFLSPNQVSRQVATMRWYAVGAFFRPMGSTSHSYTPHGVTKAVYCLLSGARCIW